MNKIIIRTKKNFQGALGVRMINAVWLEFAKFRKAKNCNFFLSGVDEKTIQAKTIFGNPKIIKSAFFEMIFTNSLEYEQAKARLESDKEKKVISAMGYEIEYAKAAP